MIDRGALVRELAGRRIADWAVVQRTSDVAVVDEATLLVRREQRDHLTMVIHEDVPNGRGSARVDLDSFDGSASDVVQQALLLARAAVGPAWATRPPAAPARVSIVDRELGKVDVAAAAILKAMKRPSGVNVTALVEVTSDELHVETAKGFRFEWPASFVRVTAIVASTDRSLEVTRTARRVADLELDAAVLAAAEDLTLLATAGAPVAGPCALVLTAEAMLHGGALGVWSVFATQADAVVERQGLTRYRPGAPVVPGADQVAEPLTILSDGALELGVRSAPVGDEGEAVRRFAIVERGRAAGLGLSPREAALRRADPNGGVRNLSVAAGTWSELPTTRVIEIRRLHSLSIDPYTGDATLELALAIEHRDGTSHPFAGGTIRLDLVAALAHARRSATVIRRGPYLGPDAVLVDAVDLIA
jgi:predicted Zn-dependent protease